MTLRLLYMLLCSQMPSLIQNFRVKVSYIYYVFVLFRICAGECERFVTSLKTNKFLVELDLCENLIGTAEVAYTLFS